MTVEVIRSAVLSGVPHGFLGRRGGISTGMFAGLNVGLGSRDDGDAVHANRVLARDAVLPGATLVTLHQVHSADVVRVDAPIPLDERPHADAMVTDRPGLLLGVLTADCGPVLLADSDARVVGAAHAGWKGALGGVTDATVAAMETLGARRERIAAAIGPSIGRRSYEVSEAFADPFLVQDDANGRFFGAGRPGHLLFDLVGYIAARLASAGVTRIDCLDEDTYGQPGRFYSYRRSCHLAEPDYGRQISLIGLPDRE